MIMAELKTYILALLAFSGVILGLNAYVADLAPHYALNIDDMSALSNAQTIQSKITDMKTSFTSHVTGTIVDIPIAAVTGSINFGEVVMYAIFGFWDTFLSGPIAHYFSLPDWVIPIISGMVMVSIIFAVFYFLKWGR